MYIKLKSFFIFLSVFMVVIFSCSNETPVPKNPDKPVGYWQSAVVDGKKISYRFNDNSTYEIINEYDGSKQSNTYSTAAPDKLVLNGIGTYAFKKEGEAIIITNYVEGGCTYINKIC